MSKGCYLNSILPWVEHFPQEKIHFILFEEMVADPRKTLIELSQDIEIDSNFYQDFHFEKRTQTIAIKNRFTHKLLLNFAPFLGTSKIRSLLKSFYFKLNTSKASTSRTYIFATFRQLF